MGRGSVLGRCPRAHRNQKHLRRDFFTSSFAGSLDTGDGSCLGGEGVPAAPSATPAAPSAVGGELGPVSPSMWLSTRWKRPSCCRKSCSTLRGDSVRGAAWHPLVAVPHLSQPQASPCRCPPPATALHLPEPRLLQPLAPQTQPPGSSVSPAQPQGAQGPQHSPRGAQGPQHSPQGA